MRNKMMLTGMGLAFVTLSLIAAAALAAESTEGTKPIIRVDKWHLLQSSGEELYGQLCASCHGAAVADQGAVDKTNTVVAPPLTYLEASGVPREHWTYVINSACDDLHHWAGYRNETMPCWRQIFREALGNEAMPYLVSAKLEAYIASIQD